MERNYAEKPFFYPLLIITAGILFYVPFIGGVHLFGWDEINFAEISREMITTGNYGQVQVNYLPFWEKPPLFFWLQVLSMKIFGVNEFAARFPNAMCGIATLLVVYAIGKLLVNRHFGALWSLIYLGTVLPFLYFKSGIIDPWFNLFIFLSLSCFIKYARQEWSSKRLVNRWLIISGIMCGLAILTKGPVALLIILLVAGVYWVVNGFRIHVHPLGVLLWLILAGLVPVVWFAYEAILNGPGFIQDFIDYQIRLLSTPDAGHGGFPGFHFIIIFIGCFPASIFALRALYRSSVNPSADNFRKWMIILLGVVLVLFTIVQSKIVHYSSLAYFPVTYLAAFSIYLIISRQIAVQKWMKVLLAATSVLIFFAISGVLAVLNRPENVARHLSDAFARESLGSSPPWGWVTWIPILIFISAIAAFFWLHRYQYQRFMGLFFGMAIFAFTAIVVYVPRAERISQRASIDFYKSLQGKDVYVWVAGHKSYAQYYYTRKAVPDDDDRPDLDFDHLYNGPIKKDLYVVTKIGSEQFLERYPQLKLIGSNGGFVFYKRDKIVSSQ